MPEPQRLGRYTLGDKIGEGGMGVVYRAQIDGAEGFSKPVAIKTIHELFARDPGIREMFITEARTAQRLHHGNIVQIIDVGVEDDHPFMVIELVDGSSLSQLMRASRRALPIADALYIGESVASALAYAHGLTDRSGRPDGVVHRDVTPRNILVSRDGVVKLADFGIAKALSAPSYTIPGTFKGSLGYLAPEQARGEAVDARADQFAAGIVLYEMLSGKNPIAARDIEGYFARLDEGIPPLVADGTQVIDLALSAIVARATAIDPSKRYPSMDELRAELEAWRVEKKVRTSNESLRATVRLLLGEDATVPTSRGFAAALAGQLPPKATASTKQQSPRAIAAVKPRWRGPALALGILGVVVIAYVVGTWSSAPATPDAAVAVGSGPLDAVNDSQTPTLLREAAPIDAVVDAAVPRDAALPRDAAVTVVVRKGRLKVNVVPYANVYLDGKPLAWPVDIDVAEGPHRLRMHNPDTGQLIDKPIRIYAGKTFEVTTW